MTKLIALYKQPTDAAAFDKAYFDTHLPLIDKLPGLQGKRVTRFTRDLMSSGFYLMAEMDFADEAALRAAMKSPEMAAAGANLDSFAKGLYSLFYAEEA
jgi:uncharacterized protein (TIGR02118 family)